MDHRNYFCYRLARTLTKNEWHLFVREVRSGKRTRHKGVQALLGVLAEHYPRFVASDLELIEELEGRLSLTVPQLRVLRNQVKQLLEVFVVENNLEQTEGLRELLLVSDLVERGATDLAEHALRKLEKGLGDEAVDILQIENEYRAASLGLDLQARKRKRGVGFDWHQLLKKLDAFAIATKLRFLCAMLSERAFVSEIEGEELKAVEVGLQAAITFGPQKNPLVNMYYHLLSLIAGREDGGHRETLQELLAVHGPGMQRVERINIFGLQINYFLAADRRGVTGALLQVFGLYKQMVEEELVFGMGAFSTNSSRNILSVGVRLGELNWTWTFLEEAKKQLPEAESEKFYRYGVANLYFANGEYAKAKKMLVLADLGDPFYKLANDSLMLRICFEAGDEDSFYATHSALGRYLYRKESISKGFRAGLQNLLKLIGPMFQLHWGLKDTDLLLQLAGFAGSCEQLANRDWVEKWLGELEEGQ